MLPAAAFFPRFKMSSSWRPSLLTVPIHSNPNPLYLSLFLQVQDVQLVGTKSGLKELWLTALPGIKDPRDNKDNSHVYLLNRSE
jgi:hypothetical protein